MADSAAGKKLCYTAMPNNSGRSTRVRNIIKDHSVIFKANKPCHYVFNTLLTSAYYPRWALDYFDAAHWNQIIEDITGFDQCQSSTSDTMDYRRRHSSLVFDALM